MRRGAGLSHARPAEPHAVGRRGPAHQPHDRAGHLAGQHDVRARRAQHRAASARHEPHRRGNAPAARRGQHAGRRRARPGRDARRRPPDRHGPRARRAGRPDRLRRPAGSDQGGRHADRRVPRCAQARRHGHQAHGDRGHAAPHRRRRARAQPEERDGRVPAAAPGVRDRRVGIGQEHADAGRAVPGARPPFRQAHRVARRARAAARRRLAHRRGVRRPVAHRQDGALEPGQLRGCVRRDPQALRRRAARRAARLRPGHVQLQRRRRPLPDMRRLGLRACRDAVPLRRVPALPRLRRPALPARAARREDRPARCRRRHARAVGGRRARPHRQRGRAALRARSRSDPRAAAHRRRRARVREAGPAGAHAVGRRGPAAEARGLPGRSGGGLVRQPAAAGAQGPAVHVQRAHHRAALRRHRQADAGLPQAARRRPFADRHRAQPRRDPRLRLAGRPRPRRRRGRRRARVRGSARGSEAPRHLAHRPCARRLRPRAGHRRPGGRRRPAAAGHAEAGARRAPGERGSDPHRQCARAQPQVARRQHPARALLGDHRRVGLGQEHAGIRHPLQRGTAPLSRIAERLRAQHRAARGAARGGRGVRHPAHGGHRAAAVARRAQEHGRHHHRGVAFPAPALREARVAALHQRRRAGEAAERGEHRGPAAA